MKSRIIILIVGLGLIAGISGCGFMGKRYLKTETERHQVSVANKNKLKLENISGNVSISRGSDSGFVFIKATKELKVKKKYLDTPFNEISVSIDTNTNTIDIETEINKSGEDGILKFNIGRNQNVDYEIVIPPDMQIEVDIVNGNFSADNLNNDLTIEIVNGDVSLSNYSGKLRSGITNGSFSAGIESTGGLDISTINGGVTLNLNNYINANLSAETINGRITDENLQFTVIKKEKKSLNGRIGTGNPEAEIKIETVNGRIKLFGRSEI
jgi:hypothetical protein